MAQLQEQARLANSGNLARSEAMLIIQAHTLDAIFNNLARRASAAEYLPQFEAYLRLGLKTQGQCRATLETLAEIKNPKPVAFVQQANIANGPQQVNNGTPTLPQDSRAGENRKSPNELIEDIDFGNQMDCRATQSATPVDTQMATLGEVNRTSVQSRQVRFES